MKTTVKSLLLGTLLTALLTSTASALNPPSGMLLGIYAFENWQGLRVQNTIPGYSAEGRLFPGDVLLRATTDGVSLFSIRTRFDLEWTKDRIGPNTPAAIEYFRPGVGLMYAWVEFQPVGGAVQAYSLNGQPVQAAPQLKAKFSTEVERPGARALFQGQAGGLVQPGQQLPAVPMPVTPNFPQNPMLPAPGGLGNPGSLFGK